jgi:hypothetical protein
MPIDPNDVIFTVDQAAEYARVTPATIRRWFDEGLKHFPTVSKVGKTGPRRDIIRRSMLLAFIEAREVSGVARANTGEESAEPSRVRPVRTTPDPRGVMTKKAKSLSHKGNIRGSSDVEVA